jgi:putative SOS response-associated peptidase YedK
MCGRAAQTLAVVRVAASSLGATLPNNPHHGSSTSPPPSTKDATKRNDNGENSSSTDDSSHEWHDNFNMSPGMDAMVFWKENGELKADRKAWGLVPKAGTCQNPLPPSGKTRMSLHFSNLMFNARTDTLFTKPTFSRLAGQGHSCVVALDGYFEWKSSPLAKGKGKKQPYFVSRKKQKQQSENSNPPYLLLAGLWTRVATGLPEEPFLDTFTMLTTEACPQIAWLHHRMPVCIWNLDLAKEWLDHPSPKVHEKLDAAAKSGTEGFDWHMVITEMSSLKYRDQTAIKALPKSKTVASFFAKKGPEPTRSASAAQTEKHVAGEAYLEVSSMIGMKRAATSPLSSTPLKKRKPEGSEPSKSKITAFLTTTNQSLEKKKAAPAAKPKKGTILTFFRNKH